MKNMLENKWFLLVILTITWGSSFILIKKSLMVFTPNQIGAVRVGLSGLILMYIGFPVLKQLPGKTLALVSLTGFFGNFLPMFLFPLAQLKISSSLAGILDASMPIFVLLLGFLLYGVKSSFIQVLGAIIGFIGAVSLMYFSSDESGNNHFWYAFIILVAAAGYAFSTLLIKERLNDIPSLKLSAAIYSIWMIPSVLSLPFLNFGQNFSFEPASYMASLYLGILSVIGTALAMILYYKLIQNTSPIFASAVTYLMPLVSVIWGILDGEKFTIWHGVGGVLILLSVYLIGKKKGNDVESPLGTTLENINPDRKLSKTSLN